MIKRFIDKGDLPSDLFIFKVELMSRVDMRSALTSKKFSLILLLICLAA